MIGPPLVYHLPIMKFLFLVWPSPYVLQVIPFYILDLRTTKDACAFCISRQQCFVVEVLGWFKCGFMEGWC